MKTYILTRGGINWSWYMTVQVDDNRHCKVLAHWRLHNTDYPMCDLHPLTDGYYHTVESTDKNRTLIGVDITIAKTVRFHVTNPAYVFSYSKHADPRTTE
jgi:hypothetical protein